MDLSRSPSIGLKECQGGGNGHNFMVYCKCGCRIIVQGKTTDHNLGLFDRKITEYMNKENILIYQVNARMHTCLVAMDKFHDFPKCGTPTPLHY